MKKASLFLIKLRDDNAKIVNEPKHIIMGLLENKNKNTSMLSTLFYRYYINKNRKSNGSRPKKANTAKISENDRLAMLIISRALGFAFNVDAKNRKEKIYNRALLFKKTSSISSNPGNGIKCSNCANSKENMIIVESSTQKKNSSICTDCYIDNAYSLAITELRNNLEGASSNNNVKLICSDTAESTGLHIKKIKGNIDICSALGITSLDKINKRNDIIG